MSLEYFTLLSTETVTLLQFDLLRDYFKYNCLSLALIYICMFKLSIL